MKFIWGLCATLCALVSLASICPDLIGVNDLVLSEPFAQIMALRAWIAIAFFLGALFFLILGGIRRRLVGRGRIALTLAIVFLVASISHGAIIYNRGITNPSKLSPDQGISNGNSGNGDITAMTFNTLGGATNSEEIYEAIINNGVDVVALPETSSARGAEIVELLAERGYDFQQFDTGTSQYSPEFTSTVLLVSRGLGDYRQTELATDVSNAVSVRPANDKGPEFIAGHPLAPTLHNTQQWRTGVADFLRLCATDSSRILLGDFNSTIDHHHAIGTSCSDAGMQAHVGGIGTWPATVPALLAAPIDHVLSTDEYVGSEGMVFELGKSDHRGLIVRLSPRN